MSEQTDELGALVDEKKGNTSHQTLQVPLRSDSHTYSLLRSQALAAVKVGPAESHPEGVTRRVMASPELVAEWNVLPAREPTALPRSPVPQKPLAK